MIALPFNGSRGARRRQLITARYRAPSTLMASATCSPVSPAHYRIQPIHRAFLSSSLPESQRAASGCVIGIFFLALAFLPKVTAFLLTIPNPVVASYAILFIGLLFVQGMKIALQDGIDYRKATIIGLAFWIGTGFQNQAIFAEAARTFELRIHYSATA